MEDDIDIAYELFSKKEPTCRKCGKKEWITLDNCPKCGTQYLLTKEARIDILKDIMEKSIEKALDMNIVLKLKSKGYTEDEIEEHMDDIENRKRYRKDFKW